MPLMASLVDWTQVRKESLSLRIYQKTSKAKKQNKPKASTGKKTIKIREEINEIENRKSMEKINKTKIWFFEKINKINKPLARLIKKKER